MGPDGYDKKILLAVVLSVTLSSTRLTCEAASQTNENKCVKGTCSGDESCLRNLNTTCPLEQGGGCMTTISAENVIAECVSKCSATPPTPAGGQTTVLQTGTPKPTAPGATPAPTTKETSTTEKPTTTSTTTTSSTAAATQSGRKRRDTSTPKIKCCEGNMCNLPQEKSVAGSFGPLMTLLVAVSLLLRLI